MAQKTQSIPVKNSRLTKNPEEFRAEIESRIESGKNLLAIEVTKRPQTPSYGRVVIMNPPVSYNEEQKANFINRYSKWDEYNEELLKRSFNDPENEYLDSYRQCKLRYIMSDVIEENKHAISRQITNLESLIERLPLIPCDVLPAAVAPVQIDHNILNSKVFIVHGHDSETKTEVARFLEQLGLEAIILHEQANQGNTIIEKIEQNTDVGFAIVLYTPCDTGAAKEDTGNLRNRARQNVVFEHGYLIAKLGRNKVCALVKGEIETPGDISGVVYIPKDNGNGWKMDVAKEMKAVGYNVDLNRFI